MTILKEENIVFVHDPSLATSTVSAWFPAGSKFDPIGKEGIAHSFEHLLLQSSSKFESFSERMLFLESLGIESNAYTSYDIALYHQTQLPGQTMASLHLLIEQLRTPKFDSKHLANEIEVIAQEDESNQTDPEQSIWRIANQALFKNTSRGRDFYGSRDSRSAITIEDLEEFYLKRYAITPLIVIASPDLISFDELRLAVGSLKHKKIDMQSEPEIFNSIPPLQSAGISEGMRSTIAISYRLPVLELSQRLALDLLVGSASNNWSSSLINALRYKQSLVYWVAGQVTQLTDATIVRFAFTCNRSNEDLAIEISLRELDLFAKHSIGPDRLHAAIAQRKLEIARMRRSSFELVWWHGWPIAHHLPFETMEAYAEALEKPTNIEQMELYQFWLNPQNRNMTVVRK